ncbi:MAG: HPr family phosphocarrier protein [Acidimicrobiaceae bacterium]|nr:HPr family phosphocarrier protein [Acidimicrobiaceae bacterium]MYG98421.1 HPr family phosphocarrier protein [Acidimicrobiaceae bacterium]MYL02552.1 HPr family phosphocarrier protein [Acidimicrobiaceae bacterium]
MYKELVITNSHGLHARPAAELVEQISSFDAGVQIEVGEKTANAASIMSLLALGAGPGNTARVTSKGPDAEAALEAVVAILTADS